MNFPIRVTSHIASHAGSVDRAVTLNRGLTVLLGPNGSGKTHLLRGLRNGLNQHANGKKVRFLSAGRMGLFEQFRSDFDGHRGNAPSYDNASYGSKSDATRRHQMETLSGDFQTLAERSDIQIKIQERLRKLFKRDLIIEWDGGNLKIFFSRLDENVKPYSSGREASGLMHLVGILSALYDDEVGVLLLDEPEVSLHPQLQAFLLNEIISVSGHPSEGGNKKIVVIATHSTEMLQIRNTDDLLSLVFCRDLNSDPIQIQADAAELNNRKVQSLVARLGQEHKLALFSNRPLLVEGPSDVIICSAVAAKIGIHLEAAGSQILPVIGKGQMPTVAKLFRMLGKTPVALTDADGVCDGTDLLRSYLDGNADADLLASTAGFSSANQMATAIYNDFCQLVTNRWEEIKVKASVHPYWVNRTIGEEDLAKRRSAFCTILTLLDCDSLLLSADRVWISMRNRLIALLGVLEQAGLFVLRKGSIESYFLSSDQFTSIGKPGAAVEEIDGFINFTDMDVEHAYGDIVRCLRYAADAADICEAEALQDLLLSVVAPAHARFKNGDVSTNYDLLARSLLGDRSKIFGLVIEGEKLAVSIESKILNVSGFPIALSKEDDVLKSIRAALENA